MNLTKNIKICGHNVVLVVTKISHENARYYFNDELLNYKVLDDIVKQIIAGKRTGCFKAKSRIVEQEDKRNPMVRIEGIWRIAIDYEMLHRIFRWWYNSNFDPDRIGSLFYKAFGLRLDAHYLKRYNDEYNRNLFDFIGYIGDNIQDGNAFMDIVLEEMNTYEEKYKLEL